MLFLFYLNLDVFFQWITTCPLAISTMFRPGNRQTDRNRGRMKEKRNKSISKHKSTMIKQMKPHDQR